MEYLYTEATIRKSLQGNDWEIDKNGNPIVIIEASNENLDFEGERVQRDALMGSKDLFLHEGVISYDHKHKPHPDNFKWDPEWNAEKYIIGQPLDAWEGENEEGELTVFVKAVLSKSNAIAQQIISKLKDGLTTVKASVGGRKVKKAIKVDTKTLKDIPTITGVDWNEVALTYKPVNQTLGHTVLSRSPKEFVKSLTAGNSANPAEMAGGNTLQSQSLEGSPVRSLLAKIKDGDIDNSKQAISHLVDKGFSEEKAQKALRLIIDKNIIGDFIMDDNVSDEIDSGMDDLEKAIAAIDGEDLSKSKKDGTYVRKGGYEYLKKADGSYEAMDDDAPEYEEDDDDKVSKSMDDGFVDIEPETIINMEKSIAVLKEENTEMKSMLKSIHKGMGLQNDLLKAIGTGVKETDDMLKSISSMPAGRKTGALNASPRFAESDTLRKSLDAHSPFTLMKSLKAAGINEQDRNAVGLWQRRGQLAEMLSLPQHSHLASVVMGKEA